VHHYLTYVLGRMLPSLAIAFFHFRLPPARRLKARTQSIIGTAILAAIFGLAAACELRAGGVETDQRGGWFGFHSSQPGAYRVPGGTILPGAAQSPGCGGGAGQYPCPAPVYVPDRRP
jgi:hypothetical protein